MDRWLVLIPWRKLLWAAPALILLLPLAAKAAWWQGMASGSTPQFPNLLGGYVTRPPWNVAGVDYAVGINAGVSLQDPLQSGSLAPALVALGGSYDSSTGVIFFSGKNNITISGWNFALHGGLGIYIENSSGATITNDNFEIGSNGQAPIILDPSSSNVTISYNDINGAGLEGSAPGYGLIESNAYGNSTIEYNLIQNSYSELMVIGNSANGNVNVTVQYNLGMNSGLGAPEGVHGDWAQITSNNAQDPNTTSVTFSFNTFVQSTVQGGGYGTQGISYNGNLQGVFSSDIMNNNTVIAEAGTNVNTFFNADYSWLNGPGQVYDNYIDPTGQDTAPSEWISVVSGTGPYSNQFVEYNNVNMVTGAYYAQNVTSVQQVTSSPGTGSEVPGNTITLTLDFSSAVTVTGSPILTLNDGGTAIYTGGSGTNALTFSYTVGTGDSTVSALAITQVNLPNGATITDGSGNAAYLANALVAFPGLQIVS